MANEQTVREFLDAIIGETSMTGIDVDTGLARASVQILALVESGTPVLLDNLLTMEQRETVRTIAEIMFATGLIVALCANDKAAALNGMAEWFALSGKLASVAHLGIALEREPLPIEQPQVLIGFVEQYGR